MNKRILKKKLHYLLKYASYLVNLARWQIKHRLLPLLKKGYRKFRKLDQKTQVAIIIGSTLLLTFLLLSLGSGNLRLKRSWNKDFLYQARGQDIALFIGEKGTNKPRIKATTPDGKNSISFMYQDATELTKKPEKKGNELIFKSVAPNIDISYQTLENGLKEELVLHSQPDDHFFIFTTEFEGTAAPVVKTTDALLPVIYDQDNNYLFHFEAPFAYDAAGARTDNAIVQLRPSPTNPNYFKTIVAVDKEWLFSPERIYPIYIDPTIVHDTSDEFATGTLNRAKDTGASSAPTIETWYQELAADEFTSLLWHFNEGTGSPVDSSGNALTGTMTNATWTTTAQILGNAAVTFDGAGDLVSRADDALLDFVAADNFTVEAWVKHNGAIATNPDYIIVKAGSTGPGYKIYMDASGDLCFAVDDDATWSPDDSACTSAVDYDDSVWHHVAGVKTGTSHIKLYVDGVEVATDNAIGATATLANTGIFYVGIDRDGTSNAWDGQIDEVRVSRVARTPEEIKLAASRRPYSVYTSAVIDLYEEVSAWDEINWNELGVATGNGETVFSSTNLVAQWNFNETSGTTANNDAEGTSCGGTPANCDGTLTGFDSTASQDADLNSSWTANNRKWGAGALMFDGVDNYINLGDNTSLLSNNTGSISFWAKPGNTASKENTVFGYGGDSTDQTLFIYLVTDATGGNFDVGLYSEIPTANKNQFATDRSFPTGQWYHIVVASNGSAYTVYVNGIAQPFTMSQGSNDGEWIGDISGGANDLASIGARKYEGTLGLYYEGILDSVQFYSQAMSASEVMANYNATNVEFQTRVGPDTTPDDGNWDSWSPTSGETQINSFDSFDSGLNPVVCSGGNNVVNGNHIFTSSGTFICDGDTTVEYLVVGGGAGGGGVGANAYGAGGGGAGQYATGTGFSVSAGSYSVTVGGGGAGGSAGANNGTNGSSSVFSSITAVGGGYGAKGNATPFAAVNGGAGASGGGGSRLAGAGGVASAGYDGGIGYDSAPWNGGGGGGSSAVGAAGSAGGAGGAGTSNSITGAAVTYAAGGSARTSDGAGAAASANTGNGGGGATTSTASTYAGGAGGSGIVIVAADSANQDSIKVSTDTNVKLEGTGSEKLEIGQTQVDASTVALWHLDETNGDNAGVDIFDATSNSFDLEIAGTNLATAVVDGIASKGRDFNGTDDIASCTDASCGGASGFDTGSSDMTVSAWVKTSAVALGSVASKMDSGGVNGWALTVEAAGTAKLWTYGGTSFGRRSSVVVVNDGKWHHIAGVYDNAGTITMYVDGVVSQGTLTGVVPTSIDDSAADFSIGFGLAGLGYFDGNIDEVKVDNVARDPEWVAEAYKMGTNHYLNQTISSTDLSAKGKLAFNVAADRPGTYLETTIGESAYANNQPGANTSALWRFEEIANDTCASGTKDVCDSSGNGLHGDEVSSPPIVQGIIGKARDFDGSLDNISYGATTNLLRNKGSGSVSIWINADSLTSAPTVIDISDGVSAGSRFEIGISTAGAVSVGGRSTDAETLQTVTSAASAVAISSWYNIVGTIDYANDSIKIYVNGVEISTTGTPAFGGATTSDTSPTVVYVGQNASPSNRFDGKIDEVSVFDTLLTAADVRQMYERSLRTYPITIDFAAKLTTTDLITGSTDTSFQIDETAYGATDKSEHLYNGDKIIVRETVDDTTYTAQGTVISTRKSSGDTMVASWESTSTFPSAGFTANASVFKWQREYFDINNLTLDSFLDGITNITLRVTSGNEAHTVWLDDLRSVSDYLTTPAGSTITSDTGERFLQYRSILSSSDEAVSATMSAVTVDYRSAAATGHWKFDEGVDNTCSGGTNDACDSSINSNDGALTGATRQPKEMCANGKCLFFDGTDDVVTITSSDDISLSGQMAAGFTIAGWAKPNSDGEGSVGEIWNKGTNNYARFTNEGTDGLADLEVKVDLATTDATVTVANAITLDTFNHIAVTYTDDGDDEIQVYINGLLRGTSTDGAGAPATDANNLLIGGSTGANFHGFIDDVKMFEVEKTEAEIKTLYIKDASTQGSSVSFDDPLADGLTGYWSMNETAADSCTGGVNDTCDKSGNGFDLAWAGNTTATTGKYGSGTTYDGAGDSAACTDANCGGTNNLDFGAGDQFSFGGWFKNTSTSTDIYFGKKNSLAASTAGYIMQQTTSDTVRCVVADGTNIVQPVSTNTYNDGNWHHAFCTIGKDNVSLYIDGVLVDQDPNTFTASFDNTDSFVVAESGAGTGDLTGQIDDLRVYRRALSEKEVASLYNLAMRREITITNSGSELTNYAVLVAMDTATLITAGKMTADCGDIRFTDSNGNSLTYWLEGGCNTATTQIWVTIPSVPSGGKTIFVTYDGTTTTNGTETWAGLFTLLYDTTCPTGWTRNVDFDNAFPYGATSYGTTGGSASHSHAQVTGSGSASSTTHASQDGVDGNTDQSGSHSHSSIRADIDTNSSVLPPYLDMIFCESSDLTVKAGLISLFDTSVPTGWTRFSALDAAFPRGASTYGGTGGSNTHTHTTTGGYNTSSNGAKVADSSNINQGWNAALAPHTHTSANGSTGNGTNTPPYIETVFGERNADGGAAVGAITITDSAPPMGWTRYSALDSNFTLGASSYGTTGGSTTHTHSVTVTTGGANSSATVSNGTGFTVYLDSHTHSTTATSDSQSNLPPYVATLYYQKNDNSDNGVTATLGEEQPVNPVQPDSVIYYKLDELNQSTANNSSADNPTLTGAITGATWKHGSDCKVSGCLDFDGTDDVVTTTNADAIDFDTALSTGVTFTAWINADSDGEGDVGEIFDKGATTYCRTDSQGSTDLDLECSLDLGTTDATVNIADGLTIDTWHHIAMVYDNDSDDEIEVYIDGILRGTSTNGDGAPATTDTSDLLIGGSTTANFDGTIDEFHLYNVPLALAQVLIDRNYNSQASLGGVLGATEKSTITGGAGSNPTGWWKMDENTGTTSTYDSSGNSFTGTLTSITESSWVPGKLGSALDFDGTADYAGCTDASCGTTSNLDFGAAAEFSYGGWFNTSTADSTVRTIIGKRATTTLASAGYGLHQENASNYIRCAISDTVATSTATSTTTYADGAWHHALCVVGASTISLYIDGILVNSGSNTSTGSLDNAVDFRIGANGNGAQFWDGSIDDIKVFRYALNQAQVAYEFNRGRPVGWWRMDEGTGTTTTYDASGKGYNLTLNGIAEGDWGTGKFGSSITYDGVDDYAYCTDASCGGTTKLDFGIASAFSYGAWFKTSTTGTQQRFIGKKSTSAASAGYMMDTRTNDTVRCKIADGTNNSAINSTATITDGTWHHTMCVHTGSALYLYLDGVLVATDSDTSDVTATLDNTSDFRLGSAGNDSDDLTGQVDDARVYNYALSAAQIRNVMNLGAQRFGE